MEEELHPQQFGVTPELFREWRSPRFGNDNPQKIKSKVWEWLVHSKLSGYASAQMMDAPSAIKAGPTWSFDRFGQSVTELAGGDTVCIGGEHEDHYDPDFCIYNDVVVIHPDSTVDFYCYPKSDFLPTDFHTATLVDERIVIIGGLGYLGERSYGYTQLYVLDLGNFEIQKPESSGTFPGWIHGHHATLSDDECSIIVTKGKIDVGEGHAFRDNVDDWKLNLRDWHWEKLASRNWTQFEIKRQDGEDIHLFNIRLAQMTQMVNLEDQYQEVMSMLSESLGFQPDINLINDLYKFDIEHDALQNDEEAHNVFYLRIEGVRVRFTERPQSLQVVIEGQISDETESLIKKQLSDKLSALENSPCEIEEY